jgi:hypothetical protein
MSIKTKLNSAPNVYRSSYPMHHLQLLAKYQMHFLVEIQVPMLDLPAGAVGPAITTAAVAMNIKQTAIANAFFMFLTPPLRLGTSDAPFPGVMRPTTQY